MTPNSISCITHTDGAAAKSGQIHEHDRLVAVDGVVVKGMTAKEVCVYRIVCFIATRKNPCDVCQFRATDFTSDTLVWSILCALQTLGFHGVLCGFFQGERCVGCV